MKVIICGGRYYERTDDMFRALDRIHEENPITELIEGGAKGADVIGASWAMMNGVPVHTERADWAIHGGSAGPIRNKKMIALKPDLVIAFPGGKGTANMVNVAKAANVKVVDLRDSH